MDAAGLSVLAEEGGDLLETLDTAGHYARPDVFQLRVIRNPRPLITEATEPETEASV